MKNIKMTLVILMILSFQWVLADISSIEIYIECKGEKDCRPVIHNDSYPKDLMVRAQPEMVLSRSNVRSVILDEKEHKSTHITLAITDEAKKKFERITGENINKRLVLVYQNIALASPYIVDRISSKTLALSQSESSEVDIKEIPFIKEIIQESQTHKSRIQKTQFYTYLILALLLLFGSLYMAFLRKPKIGTDQ